MLIDEVEAVWSAIDRHDDWAPFERKIIDVRDAGVSYAL
jgi:serine/tyrosine/threonine adenylyltransferase